jgi:5-methyltetrahydropteroyltriglutamate--homocysteine methyltransferase
VKLPAGKILIPGVVSHATDLVGRENVIAGTDCGLGGRVHPQIAWSKLRARRDGAVIASKKLWS